MNVTDADEFSRRHADPPASIWRASTASTSASRDRHRRGRLGYVSLARFEATVRAPDTRRSSHRRVARRVGNAAADEFAATDAFEDDSPGTEAESHGPPRRSTVGGRSAHHAAPM